MIRITLSALPDLAGVADRWQALEAESDLSFFQSWTWVGCLAEERFPAPVLLAAEQDGRTVALALFNRSRRRLSSDVLYLGESGSGVLDSVFVEHNGPLIARGWEHLLPELLRAAMHAPVAPSRRRRLARVVLSGVGDAPLAAAAAVLAEGSQLRRLRTRSAPCVDLAALRHSGTAFLYSLSANTRYQLRRSARLYACAGPLGLQRPASIAEAWRFLDELTLLHQATWQRRGLPGVFAAPDFRRFHRTLLARALPRGEVDLLRIAAGEQVIGYLYNFRYRGRVLAYQSGFDYAAAGPHQKPGLTSHQIAIEACAAEGIDCYDFLAGEDRYKTSLANAAVPLHWLEIGPPWSLGGIAHRVLAAVQHWRAGPPASRLLPGARTHDLACIDAATPSREDLS